MELSFPIHTMGRQRGDILLGLWNQEMPWRLRKKLSPNLVSKNPVAGVDATGVGSRASYPIKSLSCASVSPPKIPSDLEGEDFRAAAGLQGGIASCLGTLLDEQRGGWI